jgi:hypothetical protein
MRKWEEKEHRYTEKNCEICEESFKARTRDIERGWGRFCSKKCRNINNSLKANFSNIEVINKAKNQHRAQNAYKLIQRLLKKGRIKKSNCIFCGDQDTVAHHKDYNKPLDIIWMCRADHVKYHQGILRPW